MNTRQIDELGPEDLITVAVFHVLFNIEGGPVQEEHIMAVSFEDCEEEIQRRHPDAVHWEIGA